MPFNNVSDPELVAKSAVVAEAFTPEKYAYLLSLLPTPEGFTELHTTFWRPSSATFWDKFIAFL